MRDAMGGSVTLIIIVVFIVIALGYMAFNVNYTKAFRMKDKIISVYDDYNGVCTGECEAEIINYARKIGYSTGNNIQCPSNGNYDVKNNLYCIQEVNPETNKLANDAYDESEIKYYYNIVTKINLEIPVISNVFNFRFFYIYGDTKTYKKR